MEPAGQWDGPELELRVVSAPASQPKAWMPALASGVAYDTEQPAGEEINPFTGELVRPEQM